MWRAAVALIRARWRRMALAAAAIGVMLGGQVVLAGVVAADIAVQVDAAVRACGNSDLVVLPGRDTAGSAGAGSAGAGSATAGLSAEALALAHRIPGVASADGTVQASGLTITLPDGRRVTGVDVISISSEPALETRTPVSGRLPRRTGDAVIDMATARRYRLVPGETIEVGGAAEHRFTLVGVVEPAQLTASAAPQVGLLPADAVAVTGATGYSRIIISAVDGTGPDHLAGVVRARIGTPARVLTAGEFRDQRSAEILRRNDLAEVLPAQVALVLAGILIALLLSATALRTRQARAPAGGTPVGRIPPAPAPVVLAALLLACTAIVFGLLAGAAALVATGLLPLAAAPSASGLLAALRSPLGLWLAVHLVTLILAVVGVATPAPARIVRSGGAVGA